jgi:hypothetical protein
MSNRARLIVAVAVIVVITWQGTSSAERHVVAGQAKNGNPAIRQAPRL